MTDLSKYASVSAAVSDSQRALEVRNVTVERWLHEEVVPAYHALKAGPGRGMTVDQVQSALAEHRRKKS